MEEREPGDTCAGISYTQPSTEAADAESKGSSKAGLLRIRLRRQRGCTGILVSVIVAAAAVSGMLFVFLGGLGTMNIVEAFFYRLVRRAPEAKADGRRAGPISCQWRPSR